MSETKGGDGLPPMAAFAVMGSTLTLACILFIACIECCFSRPESQPNSRLRVPNDVEIIQDRELYTQDVLQAMRPQTTGSITQQSILETVERPIPTATAVPYAVPDSSGDYTPLALIVVFPDEATTLQ